MNYRNPAILAKASMFACQYCGKDIGTTVAAHSNHQRHGKGMGIKAHDCFVAYLCESCHAFVDQGNESAELRDSVWELAFRRSLPLFSHLLDEEGWRLLGLDAARGEL